MMLSKNFSLDEFTRSNLAEKKGFTEQYNPSLESVENLRKLCSNVLQPLRDELGFPIDINSGYRCKRLNDSIKGAVNSDHLYGKAADITLKFGRQNLSRKLFEKIIEMKLPFRQLIDEKNYSWVHISFDINDNKQQILHLL